MDRHGAPRVKQRQRSAQRRPRGKEQHRGFPQGPPHGETDTGADTRQRARQHIFESWTRETDPKNLQPRVSKFNLRVAEFLRGHSPRGVEQPRLEACLDAVEAPCSRREENLLRAVFDAEYPSFDAKSKAIVEEVERIGLEPFATPEPLPPIGLDEVHLVCWLAIERSNVQ